jgi:tRNA (mo5U34)-methyltransferase
MATRTGERGTAGDHESAEDARAAVDSVELWYHTMELAPGVVTPGWFDLRPIVERMPWPDVRGKRCLDVGPWDGFLSFELERRGASEVVCTDISSPAEWDWPLLLRRRGPAYIEQLVGAKTGGGFEVARRLQGSSVERVEISVYDLSPERLGSFDVVVCGSLMLHLRDPVRALEAIRGVCEGRFLSAEQIRPGLTLLRRRSPLADFRSGDRCQWWIPNAAGHRALVSAAGFEIERIVRPYSIPLGPGHPGKGTESAGERLLQRLATGTVGLPHSALLARPAQTP